MTHNPHDDAQEDLSAVWGSLRRMVRKLMISKKDPEDTQRHKLFSTRCRVQGNLCDLIIDGGSQENVISRKAVQKLKLTPSPHPEPYDIGWVTNAGEICVTERCKVSFSIGKYSDEHYCDIVDMDACEILLGRPWQFNMNATYSGRQNIYRFIKEGVKYKLIPLGETKSTTRETNASVLKIEHDKATIWSDMKEANENLVMAKKGTYKENVEVGKKKKNVMIVGDCMDSTILTGSLNVIDGSTTFDSAILATVGDRFILQDIWIQNTVKPENNQALEVGDGVMVFLGNSQIIGGHHKLQPRSYDSCKIKRKTWIWATLIITRGQVLYKRERMMELPHMDEAVHGNRCKRQ